MLQNSAPILLNAQRHGGRPQAGVAAELLVPKVISGGRQDSLHGELGHGGEGSAVPRHCSFTHSLVKTIEKMGMIGAHERSLPW